MLDKLLIYRKLSRNQVKLIAMISMLIDHCGKAFCVPDSALYVIMRYAIGRMAFPLFLMLFIDGFYRTKRPWRHVIDLVIFSLLSEPGFDRVIPSAADAGSVYDAAGRFPDCGLWLSEDTWNEYC